MMFPENLVECREKKDSVDTDLDAMVRLIWRGTSGLNEKGQPAVSDAKKVSNIQEATAGAPVNAAKENPKVKATEDPVVKVYDVDDDWFEDLSSIGPISADSFANNIAKPGSKPA